MRLQSADTGEKAGTLLDSLASDVPICLLSYPLGTSPAQV